MSLLVLPPEILELIATHVSLSLLDISRLSLTCRRLHSTINSSWHLIATERWSWWPGCSGSSNEDWYSLCRQRHLCEVRLSRFFGAIIKKGVRLYLIDDEELEQYDDELSNTVCLHNVTEYVLKDILKRSVREANLSQQYYGLSLYEYLRRRKQAEQWRELLSLANEQQQLIKAGILISEWIDPFNELIETNILDQVNTIANEVAKDILKCTVHDDDNTTAIDKVKELSLPRIDILKAINRVMFVQFGFKPAVNDYYHLNSSLIDQVLLNRQGIPITLSAVYQAIAYKLGVILLPVNFPAHFLLKAPQNLHTGEGEVFVDAYGKGQMLTQEECLALVPFMTIPQPDMFNSVQPHKAMIRMVANIYSRGQQFFGLNFDVGRQWNDEQQKWGPLILPSALSLQLLLCGLSPASDFTRQVAVDAANLALDLRFNVKQVIHVMSDMLLHGSNIHVLTKLQRAQSLAERRKKFLLEQTRVKHRDASKVYYTIGDIMKHRRYDYRCVIYGWDLRCEMTPAWIEQMGVHHLPLGPNQPFYNVLVEDGTNRYAAQESLSPCPQQEMGIITHWEVGKYFSGFTGNSYIPNEALLDKYPPTVATTSTDDGNDIS